jgi:hypothetical protein
MLSLVAIVSLVGNSSWLYPFWAINWRRTSAAVIGVYSCVVRNCGSAWLCPSTMAVISFYEFGNWSSLCLRPRNLKPSTHTISLSTSYIPLRMVPRFQPGSRSASLWPPSPSTALLIWIGSALEDNWQTLLFGSQCKSNEPATRLE